MRFLVTVLVLSIILISCEKTFSYNANEIQIEEKDRNQNTKNLERLRSKPENASFNFVVIADTQRFYEELDDLVEKSVDGLDLLYFYYFEDLRPLVPGYILVTGHVLLAVRKVNRKNKRNHDSFLE